ncbi:MAG: hypothetical protein WC464_05730 [Bdellovibrionales bacterium]
MSLAKMTAAVSELKIDNITYRISPLRDMDFGEFERWVQDRYMDVALRNLELLSEKDREVLIKAAYEKAAALTASSPEAIGLMTTVEGAAKLLWLSLRRERPDITIEAAQELATHPKTVKLFMDKIHDLNRIQSYESKKKNGSGKDGNQIISHEELYRILGKQFSLSPSQIAEMTPYQQLVYLGQAKQFSRFVTVDTMDDAQELLRNLKG